MAKTRRGGLAIISPRRRTMVPQNCKLFHGWGLLRCLAMIHESETPRNDWEFRNIVQLTQEESQRDSTFIEILSNNIRPQRGRTVFVTPVIHLSV